MRFKLCRREDVLIVTVDTLEQRLHYLSQKYNEYNLPLYLSYPVESQWRQKVEEADIVRDLQEAEEARVYVHIPFCRTACYYCCCDRVIGVSEAGIDEYLDVLEMEMALKLAGRERRLRTDQVHCGGGTPAYLSIRQLERLYGLLERQVELTERTRIKLEAYPDKDMIHEDKLRSLKAMGFNYISFGIQDFDERVLRAINRRFHPAEAKSLIRTAVDLDFTVNIDLCYGLPYQGLKEFEAALREVMSIGPDKIVIYPYAHYPAVYPMQRNIPALSLPNVFIKSLQLKLAHDLLGDSYEKRGMDTFIRREGKEFARVHGQARVRDFMGASERGSSNLLGLGKSAISRVNNRYYKNVPELDRYGAFASSGRLPLELNQTHKLSRDDLIREEMITGQLLSDYCIDKAAAAGQFCLDFDSYFHHEWKELKAMEQDGMLKGLEGTHISATEAGSYFIRTIAHVFDPYYNSQRNGEF